MNNTLNQKGHKCSSALALWR